MNTFPDDTHDGWAELRNDLGRRWRRPFKHVSYCSYFVAGVAGIGAWGVWLELINFGVSSWTVDTANLKTAIITYYLALLGTTFLQVQIGGFKNYDRIIASIFTGLLLVAGSWLLLAKGLPNWLAFPLGMVGVAASLWFWWVANADNADYHDDPTPPPTATIGGENANGPISGTLSGFES